MDYKEFRGRLEWFFFFLFFWNKNEYLLLLPTNASFFYTHHPSPNRELFIRSCVNYFCLLISQIIEKLLTIFLLYFIVLFPANASIDDFLGINSRAVMVFPTDPGPEVLSSLTR